MFVVRKSASLQRKVISLRMDKDSAVPIKDFPVKESQYSKHLGTPSCLFFCFSVFFPLKCMRLAISFHFQQLPTGAIRKLNEVSKLSGEMHPFAVVMYVYLHPSEVAAMKSTKKKKNSWLSSSTGIARLL